MDPLPVAGCLACSLGLRQPPVALPRNHVRRVLEDLGVDGQQMKLLNARLRHEHAVKRVPMDRRQLPQLRGMSETDREQIEPLLLDCPLEVVLHPELPQRLLERHLPRRGRADDHGIARVRYDLLRPRGESPIVRQPPEDHVRVEKHLHRLLASFPFEEVGDELVDDIEIPGDPDLPLQAPRLPRFRACHEWTQHRYRPSRLADDERLAAGHPLDDLREVRLGLMNVDGLHAAIVASALDLVN